MGQQAKKQTAGACSKCKHLCPKLFSTHRCRPAGGVGLEGVVVGVGEGSGGVVDGGSNVVAFDLVVASAVEDGAGGIHTLPQHLVGVPAAACME